jgi:general secretion pathway protein G
VSRKRSRATGQPAFTLIEILVVIVIIAMLASLVAPKIFRYVGDANTNAARNQIETIVLALRAYKLDNGTYPSTEQSLAALRAAPARGEAAHRWRGPYLVHPLSHDPWNRPYVYVAPGRINPSSFDLYTLGRDGIIGGTGDDTDVTSWHGPVREPTP